MVANSSEKALVNPHTQPERWGFKDKRWLGVGVKIWLSIGLTTAFIGIGVLAGIFVPVIHKRTITVGEDSYQYHRPLFARHIAAQDEVNSSFLTL